MDTRDKSQNMLAGVLMFAFMVMNLLSQFVTFRTLYGTNRLGFMEYLTSNPLLIILPLMFIPAGICLLVGTRIGSGISFFAIGAVYLLMLGQAISQRVSHHMGVSANFLLQTVVPELLWLAAMVLVGLFCVIPGKMPKSRMMVMLPAILLFASIAFALLGVLAYIPHAKTSLGRMGLRFLFQSLRTAVGGLALLFACRWAVEGAVGKPAVAQVPGSIGMFPTQAPGPFPSPGPASVQQPVPGAAPAPEAMPSTWYCPNCGQANDFGRFCKNCGTPRPTV